MSDKQWHIWDDGKGNYEISQDPTNAPEGFNPAPIQPPTGKELMLFLQDPTVHSIIMRAEKD